MGSCRGDQKIIADVEKKIVNVRRAKRPETALIWMQKRKYSFIPSENKNTHTHTQTHICIVLLLINKYWNTVRVRKIYTRWRLVVKTRYRFFPLTDVGRSPLNLPFLFHPPLILIRRSNTIWRLSLNLSIRGFFFFSLLFSTTNTKSQKRSPCVATPLTVIDTDC